MYRLINEAPYPRTSVNRPNGIAVRTYRQIADVLEERDGKPITADRVAHICRSAEIKIINALSADHVFGKRRVPA